MTQYPGGKLSHMYGAKWIFSTGLLISGALSAILPYVTVHWGRNALIAIRIGLGLAEARHGIVKLDQSKWALTRNTF